MSQDTLPSTDQLFGDTLVAPILRTALEDARERMRSAQRQILEAHRDAYAIIRVMTLLGEKPTDAEQALPSPHPQGPSTGTPSPLALMTLQEAVHISNYPIRATDLFIKARGPRGLECPKCRQPVQIQERRPKIEYFRCEPCNRTFSLKNSTPMHGSKVSLGKWLLAAYLLKFHPEGSGVMDMSVRLELNINTAAHMHSTMERVCTDPIDPLKGLVTLIAIPYQPEDGDEAAPRNETETEATGDPSPADGLTPPD